jgi:hypothetical protein
MIALCHDQHFVSAQNLDLLYILPLVAGWTCLFCDDRVLDMNGLAYSPTIQVAELNIHESRVLPKRIADTIRMQVDASGLIDEHGENPIGDHLHCLRLELPNYIGAS